MITEHMAAALVDAAFDGLGDLVERVTELRRKNACWRKEKWRAFIELTNFDRKLRDRKPRWQPLRRLYLRRASAQCTANKRTCSAISDAVDRRLAESKDRLAKGDVLPSAAVV